MIVSLVCLFVLEVAFVSLTTMFSIWNSQSIGDFDEIKIIIIVATFPIQKLKIHTNGRHNLIENNGNTSQYGYAIQQDSDDICQQRN